MEVNNHTVDIHIPTAEEIYKQIEDEQEKSIKQIVKEILGDIH